jgi:hypothetical protein
MLRFNVIFSKENQEGFRGILYVSETFDANTMRIEKF